MKELLVYAPLLNTIIIIGVAFITVLRVGDIMKNVQRMAEDTRSLSEALDKRLAVIEAVCRINHPHLYKIND
jgi:hypothetical protein